MTKGDKKMETALTQTVTVGSMKVAISADRAETTHIFRVGDKVKVLVKDYSDYAVYYGVIASFDNFQNLPSITVCYIEDKYGKGELKFAAVNSQTNEKIEMVPCVPNDKIGVEKGDMMERMQAELDKKVAEVEDIKRKMQYFDKMFRRWFDLSAEVPNDD